MKQSRIPPVAIPLLLAGWLGVSVSAVAQVELVNAQLKGFAETPAVSTAASGKFMASVNAEAATIEFTLTYRRLEAPVTQAHIHFGQEDVAGGISVWLCSNLPSPPTPAGFNRPCPQTATADAPVSGTVTAADVVGPTGQGIAPGEFDELIRALRKEVTYVNVHSEKFPAGEIRGQIDD